MNIGTRQNLRERNANVHDVPAEPAAVGAAIVAALEAAQFAPDNIFGDGNAAARIVARLRDTALDKNLMLKVNAY